jgi:hypothetical protein
VPNTATNMGVEVLYCNLTYILSHIFPGVVLLDHVVVLFLIFGGVSILFSVIVVLTNLHSHQHGVKDYFFPT